MVTVAWCNGLTSRVASPRDATRHAALYLWVFGLIGYSSFGIIADPVGTFFRSCRYRRSCHGLTAPGRFTYWESFLRTGVF